MYDHEQPYPFKKSNVAIAVVLTILTAGIYIAIWFLRRKKGFNSLSTPNFIPYKWWVVATIYLCVSFFINLIGWAYLTPFGEVTIESINIILTFYFLGLLYYSSFRAKEALEERFQEVTVHPVLLVFFHVWYLQFKMNRLEESVRI